MKTKDHYTIRAKQEGYAARSAYKLKEIQKEYSILKEGAVVLELGCSPGGWTQIALEVIGPNGRIVGMDLNPTEIKDTRFTFMQGDFTDEEESVKITGKYDAIISDAAPKTTGQRDLDQGRSEDIVRAALQLTKDHLKVGGNLLCKIFQGPEYEKILMEVKKKFSYYKTNKPDASKSTSKEMYIIGKGFRG